jgi:lectin-like protein
MDAILLRAVTVLGALGLAAGCYAPEVADCAITCAMSQQCPDGLDCRAGFCRIQGAAGICEAGDDAATDGSAAADAAPTSDAAGCPPLPLHMQGCEAVNVQDPVGPHCFTVCTTPATGTAALAFDVGFWHLATLETPAEGAAAREIAGDTPVWIGLEQNRAATAPDDDWQWVGGGALVGDDWGPSQPDDGDGNEDGTEQCAGLAPPGWSDEPCTATRAFLIEHM